MTKRFEYFVTLALVMLTLVWALPMDAQPGAKAYVASTAFLSDGGFDSIVVIDLEDNVIEREIVLPSRGGGTHGHFVALSPDASVLYVTGKEGFSCPEDRLFFAAIDTVTNRVADLIFPDEVGCFAIGRPAFGPDPRFVYATLSEPPALLTIDVRRREIISKIPVRSPGFLEGLLGVAITPDGEFAYVAPFNPRRSHITAIDLVRREVAAEIPIPECEFPGLATDVALTPDGERALLPVQFCRRVGRANVSAGGCAGDCDADGNVTLAELVTGVGIALGALPVGRCGNLDADGSGAPEIDELVSAVTSLLNRCGSFSGQSDGFAVVVDTDAMQALRVIEFGFLAGSRTQKAEKGEGAGGFGITGLAIELSPDGRLAYVANCSEALGLLCVIDLSRERVVRTIPIGDGFIGDLAVTADGALLYATAQEEDSVIAIDTRTNRIVARIPVRAPDGIAIGVPPG